MKTKEQLAHWKKENLTKTRCRTVVIVVFMDIVTLNEAFIVGFFVVTNMATFTTTYRKPRATCCSDTNQRA